MPAFRERRAIRLLFVFFVFSLVLLNPWVRGDGVGYYAFARALLIEHSLDFTRDYLHANLSFRNARVDEAGRPRQEFVTVTGHLDNHFTIGPAILWSPFLLAAHSGVLAARALGSSVPADGFSAPYRIAMALGTAVYGFLGLLISYRMSRKYVEWPWALLATIGIWWASSLVFYMYFNPSWSHAHSAFCVALFLWYWHETRDERTLQQWLLLGLLAGLMLNVYFANAMVLATPGAEAIMEYGKRLRAPLRDWAGAARLLGRHAFFGIVAFACMLPAFLTRCIIYGNPFESGYIPIKEWLWRSPALLSVLFSSDHGLLSWTPILLLACTGLVLFAIRQPRVGGPLFAAGVAFYLFIACYPDWDGLSSFGNRFFVSLTPLFVLGLAILLARLAPVFARPRIATAGHGVLVGLLIVWNLFFLFQWATHLVPVRGPISWREMVRNQFLVVPGKIRQDLRAYLFHRSGFMKTIEQKDIEQLQAPPPDRP